MGCPLPPAYSSPSVDRRLDYSPLKRTFSRSRTAKHLKQWGRGGSRSPGRRPTPDLERWDVGSSVLAPTASTSLGIVVCTESASRPRLDDPPLNRIFRRSLIAKHLKQWGVGVVSARLASGPRTTWSDGMRAPRVCPLPLLRILEIVVSVEGDSSPA